MKRMDTFPRGQMIATMYIKIQSLSSRQVCRTIHSRRRSDTVYWLSTRQNLQSLGTTSTTLCTGSLISKEADISPPLSLKVKERLKYPMEERTSLYPSIASSRPHSLTSSLPHLLTFSLSHLLTCSLDLSNINNHQTPHRPHHHAHH
jgi:hypothetical protein